MNSLATGAPDREGREQTAFDRVEPIVRRNLALLLVCLLLVPAAALAFSLTQEPRYTASASLLFRDPGLDEKLFGTTLFGQEEDPQRAAATNLKLVSLREIAERTAAKLRQPGLTADEVAGKVSVTPEGESDIIVVEAEEENPRAAATLANRFAREYIQFRREADRAKVGEAQTLVQKELAALTPEQALTPEGATLQKRARELHILASLQTGNAELVQVAQPPAEPSAPKPWRNLALGLLLGLALGVGLTFLREQLDRRLKDVADISAVFELPILATIPESRAISRSNVQTDGVPVGAEGEAFQMLRANLRYFNVDQELKSMLVTSAAPQDGKTTVSWNLALAEARAGKGVLYIEADLRRPTLANQLGIATPRGLSLVLAGAMDPVSAVQDVHGFDVLLAGPIPPNPAELLESQRMRQLISWGEEHYDRVIIDTPPTAVVADAIPLLSEVTGVVVVVRLRRSRRDAAEHLRDHLRHVGAPVLGLVINGATRTGSYYYDSPAAPPVFTEVPEEVVLPARRQQTRQTS